MALYDLLTWMSPAYPIGAFSHSSGLEWAVERGLVHDRASTESWITDTLVRGAGWNDAVVFAHAFRAARACDAARLRDVAELAAAALTSHERRMESTAQGAAFRRIARETSPVASFGLIAGICDADLAYPVAAAVLMAGHDVPLTDGLTAFFHGQTANLVSAAQRLVPLGQTDAQRAMVALRPTVLDVAARAAALDDSDPFESFSSAALTADFVAMAHETQYTRLFRT